MREEDSGCARSLPPYHPSPSLSSSLPHPLSLTLSSSPLSLSPSPSPPLFHPLSHPLSYPLSLTPSPPLPHPLSLSPSPPLPHPLSLTLSQNLQDMNAKRVETFSSLVTQCAECHRRVFPVVNTCLDNIVQGSAAVDATQVGCGN